MYLECSGNYYKLKINDRNKYKTNIKQIKLIGGIFMKTTYMVKNVFCDGKVRIAEFGDNHLLLLTYLQKFTTFQGKIYFYFDTAFLELGITKFPLQKQLYQCLYDLKKWGLINITNNVDFNKIDRNTLITLDKVNYDRNYTLLLADEIDKILIAKEDIRVRKTMLYLYTIIEHRKYDKDFCYARRKTFKDDMQIKSNARVQNGLNKLKKYELIDFDNAGVVKDQKGRIFQANNIYVTTYTEGYEDILANAIQGNGEYHTENNSLVMPKKEKATRNEIPVANVDKSSISHNNININAENNQIEFDEKILNYEYERDYAQLLVKHVYIGMKENPILDKYISTI